MNTKERLFRDLCSLDRKTVLDAIQELCERGWLYDNSFRGANLQFANLRNIPDGSFRCNGRVANFREANLSGASFSGTDMPQVYFGYATLITTNFHLTNLFEADFDHSNLTFANFTQARGVRADFIGANLFGANLKGANLKGARLVEANLLEAEFDTNTQLPDGSYWSVDTDVARFVDSRHRNFWGNERPDW